MKVSFELTMPNVGSWNGKWTGATKKYYVIRTLFKTSQYQPYGGPEHVQNLLAGKPFANFYFRWSDGWGANVQMQVVDPPEARKRLKQSAGFCGYEWMIDSILKHGKILADEPVTH